MELGRVKAEAGWRNGKNLDWLRVGCRESLRLCARDVRGEMRSKIGADGDSPNCGRRGCSLRELADDSPPSLFYSQAVVWEHLMGNLPLYCADCQSSGKTGTFDDEQSVVNLRAITVMNVKQKFSTKIISAGEDVSALAGGFMREYGELNIVKTMGAIYINGNAGGVVDESTGRLKPGSCKECGR